MTSAHETRSRTPDLPVSIASTHPLHGRDDDEEPTFHPLVERLWAKLPQAWRVMDSRQDWTAKRILAGLVDESTEMDDILAGLWGARPIGPAAREPWARGMSDGELRRWRNARRSRPSTLGDPRTAHASWLDWLAQHVGVKLDPAASEQERRDMIRYGTSGWRAGTPGSIANAARSALTGTRFSRVIPGWRPDIRETGMVATMWDLTVVTRTSETPDAAAVLATIERKGAKPAGVVLHHREYEAPWDVIEALRPTWADWERTRSPDNSFHATTWTELEETGLSYADVPGQLFRNASFEQGVEHWIATGGSIEPVVGGIDSFGAARLSAVGAVSAAYERENLIAHPTLDEVAIEPAGYRLARTRSGVVVSQIDTADTIVAAQGPRYGRFLLTSTATGGPTVFDQAVAVDPVPVAASTEYVFAAMLNSSGGLTGYGHIGLEWLDANGVQVGATVNGADGTNVQFGPADRWTPASLTATAPAAARQARMVLWFTSAEPGVTRTMRFDAVHAERSATYDGTFIVGKIVIPAQTPGIDLTQEPVRATFHEDYRVALNLQPVGAPCSVRVRAQFLDEPGTVLDTQTWSLGTFAPGPWRRTRAAEFRTNTFAARVRITLQFRDMAPGQVVDIDATEARPFVGGV